MVNVGIGDDHGAGCAIERNGNILYAASEERFSRHKNDAGFPILALQRGLEYLGLTVDDIQNVFIATTQRTDYLGYEYRRDCILNVSDHLALMNDYWKNKLAGEDYPQFLPYEYVKKSQFFKPEGFYGIPFDAVQTSWKNEDFCARIVHSISEKLGLHPNTIRFVDHHTCHSAYALSTTMPPTRDCAVITVDSYGDGRNQCVWLSRNGKITCVAESQTCPLARIYRLTTLYLGMKPLEHEYKVMGLSSYANQSYYNPIVHKLFDLVEIDQCIVSQNKGVTDLYEALSAIYNGERFDNIAGAVQHFTEMVLQKLFTAVHERYGVRDFYYTGGVAMNVKANKKLLELDFVDSLIIPGAPDDLSVPIGACLAQYYGTGKIQNISVPNLYLGPSICTSDVKKVLVEKREDLAAYQVSETSNEKVADLLVAGSVVGRVVGRMEFGARALGNRSLLALPSSWDTVDLINDMIKNRDFWMPFAASVLDIDMDALFIGKWRQADPRFMTVALDTNLRYWNSVKAGTHRKDKTMRVHMVCQKDNPEYYALLLAIRCRTGLGAVLNTSFNLHGYPIVCDATEAVDILIGTSLEHLILDNVLISQRSQQTAFVN